MNKYLFIFFLFPLLVARSSYSQFSTDSLLLTSTDSTNSLENELHDQTPLTTGFSLIYGYAIPHSKEVVNIRGTNPIGYELNLNWLLYTKETWDDCHCYPRIGFHLGFYDFDINEISDMVMREE